MYCVVCGHKMDNKTQIGLICMACHVNIGLRGGSRAVLEVRYCLRCGGLLRHSDNGVMHGTLLHPCCHMREGCSSPGLDAQVKEEVRGRAK
jgi:hypothetical protein